MLCVGVRPGKSQKSALNPLELELQALVICPMWVLGTKSGRLEEQRKVLTTELSPAHRCKFWNGGI